PALEICQTAGLVQVSVGGYGDGHGVKELEFGAQRLREPRGFRDSRRCARGRVFYRDQNPTLSLHQYLASDELREASAGACRNSAATPVSAERASRMFEWTP